MTIWFKVIHYSFGLLTVTLISYLTGCTGGYPSRRCCWLNYESFAQMVHSWIIQLTQWHDAHVICVLSRLILPECFSGMVWTVDSVIGRPNYCSFILLYTEYEITSFLHQSAPSYHNNIILSNFYFSNPSFNFLLQPAVTTSLFLTSIFEIPFSIFLFYQQLEQQISFFWLPFQKSISKFLLQSAFS